jgi:hypothetical protein
MAFSTSSLNNNDVYTILVQVTDGVSYGNQSVSLITEPDVSVEFHVEPA